jgi:hypothetical protein
MADDVAVISAILFFLHMGDMFEPMYLPSKALGSFF